MILRKGFLKIVLKSSNFLRNNKEKNTFFRYFWKICRNDNIFLCYKAYISYFFRNFAADLEKNGYEN